MVKSQRRIGVTNIRNTSSHGDRPLWQILYSNVKAKRSHGPDTNQPRQTDKQGDSYINLLTSFMGDIIRKVYPEGEFKMETYENQNGQYLQ